MWDYYIPVCSWYRFFVHDLYVIIFRFVRKWNLPLSKLEVKVSGLELPCLNNSFMLKIFNMYISWVAGWM